MKKNIPIRSLIPIPLALVVWLAATTAVQAALDTWTGGGATDNWSDAANWGGTAPNATGDDLVFAGSTRPTPNNDLVTAANSVTLNPGTSFTIGGTALTLSAGLTNSALSNNWNIATALGANQSFNAAAGTTLTLSKALSGTATLTYGGLGSYVVAAVNTASGNVTVDAATVTVNSGATLFCSSFGFAGFRSVTIQNGGKLIVPNYSNGTGQFWGAPSDGAGNVTYGTGGGTFRMMNSVMAANVNKGITVNNGVTARFEIPTGTSCNWFGFNGTRDFLVNSGGALVFGGGGNFITSRLIWGAGGIQITDGGTLTLSNVVCTYSGSTILTSGTLALTNGASIDSSANISIASGATFDVSAFATYNLPATITGSGTGTTVGTSAANIKGGTAISFGSRPIVLNYNGANPALYISQGALLLTNNSVTVNGSPLSVGTYTIISVAGGSITTNGSFIVSGTAIPVGTSASLSVSGGNVQITITPGRLWSGALSSQWSTSVLSSPKNWTAVPGGSQVDFINGTPATFPDGASTATVDLSVADVSPSAVTFSANSLAYTLVGANRIAGTASLTVSGSGTVTIANTNSFTGAVNIGGGGTLVANTITNGSVNSALGAGTSLVLNGGTLSLTGGSASSDRSLSVTAPSTIQITNPATIITLTGPASGSGGLTKNGTGTLIVSNTTANTRTGSTTINAGVVNARKADALGSGAVIVTNAALELQGNITLGTGPMTLSGTGVNGAGVLHNISGANTNGSAIALAANSTVAVDAGQLTLNGIISGATLTKTGAGTLTLGAINTFSGNLNISNGTVQVTAVRSSGYPSGLGSGFNTVNLSPGTTLAFTTGNTYFHGPINNNGATITCNTASEILAAANPLTFDVAPGVINGSSQAQLREVGAKVVVTAAASGSSFSVAQLQLQGSEGLTVVPFNVARGASNSDLTVSSPISQAGGTLGILKQGNGIMTLTGTNTYTGQTEVQAGTLALSGSLASPVLVDSGATLYRGTANVGPMTINNTLTANAGSTIFLKLDKTGGVLTNDSVAGLSSVTCNGTLIVSNITSDATLLALGDTVQLFSTGGTGFAIYSLPALPAGLTWDVTGLTGSGSVTVVAGTPVTTAPTFNPPAGSYYKTGQTVTMSALNPPGSTIYYTINGSTPTGASPSGISPLTITLPANANVTIQAYAQAPSSTASSIVSAAYNTVIPTNIALSLASGPTGMWPLSELVAPTAYDLSSNNLNGTYSGAGVTYGVTGPVGSTVVTLDGASGNAAIPYSATLNPSGPFTAEGWFNPDIVDGSLRCALASFNINGGGPRSGWLIYQSAAGWEFRTYNQNGTATAVDITGGTPTVGQWDHVAAVWDGTNGYIYVNGVLANTSGATTYAPNGIWPLTIGMRSDGTFLWPGSVGNVGFYRRALNAREIAEHAQNTPLNLNISQAGTNVVVSWALTNVTTTLQAAPDVTGVYTDVPGATSPWTNTPTGGSQFYRVKF